MVILSDKDLEGTSWQVATAAGKEVISGKIGQRYCGRGDHTAQPFNYKVDLSGITRVGSYVFKLGRIREIQFSVRERPYKQLVTDMLRFFRTARSGTAEALLHPPSHLGDAKVLIHYPLNGLTQSGLWQPSSSGETVDMLGGWYDAADYIKFTLTNALATYLLLKAYETNPQLFTKKLSRSKWIDILDEARFGLQYLLKTFPSPDHFIIQVSGKQDHRMGFRLPQADTRDGKREAFSAISQAHMGITAAALALGARILEKLKDPEAKKYREKAVAIFHRALLPSALKVAVFEFDDSGNYSFYKDPTLRDNMQLGAIELYHLTKDPFYLKQADYFCVKEGREVSWRSVQGIANLAIKSLIPKKGKKVDNEMKGYLTFSQANIWGIPGPYSWGSLLEWCGTGCLSGLYYRELGNDQVKMLMANLVDYIFGKNNWGVGFIFSKKYPNSVQNIYSQIYQLTNTFPEGVISEGPARRSTHDANLKFFKFDPKTRPTVPFNTDKVVFYDHGSDFVTQESTIVGQAYALLFLTLVTTISK
jgi:hypothetical protein